MDNVRLKALYEFAHRRVAWRGESNIGYGIILIPLAMLVGISRVCLGVHYPGDVLMGQLLALLTGAIVLR